MKFLKSIVALILLTAFSGMNINAQNNNQSGLLVLDNYTIPTNTKGAKVGMFISPQNESVTIVDDPSGIFEIGKNNELQLKKNKEITSVSPSVYTIKVKNGNQEKSFDVIKNDFIKNKVVAHRGAWKHTDVSQNTLGSIRHAIELGCEAAEIDVWLTKDNKVVLCHDIDLDGRIIEKTNLADIKAIKLKNNESAPTLEECLELIKSQNKTRLIVELKSNKGNENVLALADSVVNIVHRMNAQAWVDYISFDYRGLKTIRDKDATVHLSFLEPAVDLDLQKMDGMSGIDYHHSLYDKMEKLHERCLILGLTTNAWTVNDEKLMNRFLDMDINLITTDEPEMLLNIISTNRK